MPKGLYKSGEGWVRVRYDDGMELDVVRPQYEAQGYEPPYDDLPDQPEKPITPES